ncbi:MAG TPA: hypothetical protein VLG50_01265 [Candidatus Saccharimonadales bacterium]|nr:hypothetical protein [Candidatus Saccharimonadales bacterium]
MKHHIFLVLALSLLTHETYNSQAVQSSVTKNNSDEIKSKEEFLEFLTYFFDTKTGFIQSAHLPESQFTHVQNKAFKGRIINYLLSFNKCIDNKFGHVHVAFWSLAGHKPEISQEVYRANYFRFSVPEIEKFLKILYCEEPGRAEFINSRLTLRYHSESERDLSIPGDLEKELLIQQVALLKIQQQSMSKSLQEVPKLSQETQTELPAQP